MSDGKWSFKKYYQLNKDKYKKSRKDGYTRCECGSFLSNRSSNFRKHIRSPKHIRSLELISKIELITNN